MSKASNINSLTELRERREAIKAEQEAARRGLTSTLAEAPGKAKEYALEDLALPALGIGLAAYVGYRIFRNNGPKIPEQAGGMMPQVAPVPVSRPQTEARPAYVAPPRPEENVHYPPQEKKHEGIVEKSFDFASLLTAGRLLIPAAQAIISVVQSQSGKHDGGAAGAE